MRFRPLKWWAEQRGEMDMSIRTWHKFYAWHPCGFNADEGAWLEWVERRCVYTRSGLYVFEYRELKRDD